MGNTKSIIDGVNGGSTSYIYDVHNRLSSSLAGGYSVGAMNYSRGISFAKNGNITAKSDVGSYSYQGDSHRVIKAGAFDFTYDVNGNKLKFSGFVFYTNIVGYQNRQIGIYMQFRCFRIVARMRLAEALCSHDGETGWVFLGLGLFLHPFLSLAVRHGMRTRKCQIK